MRWKLIGGIAAGLVIAILVTVYLILSSYDFNHFKPEIAQAVKDATGRELTLGGDFRLKIGFAPALVLENVGFQNAPWGSRPDMARIKRFEVQVALIPLVMGKIEIRRFVLVEPDILIETDQSGRSNLAFENVRETSPVQPQGETQSKETKLPMFTIGEIKIDQGTIRYTDGPSGRTYTVTLENLTGAAPAPDSLIQLKCKGAYNGKVFEISGTLGPLFALTDPGKIWPVKLEAKAGGAEAKVDGEIRDAIRTGAYTLSVDAQGQSIVNLAELAGVEGVPDLGPFKVFVKIEGRRSSLSIERFGIDLGKEDLAEWDLAGSIKEPLSGRGLDIGFKIHGKELARLEQVTGRPVTMHGPFQASGHVSDIADKIYRVADLNLSAGENDIEGSLEVNLSADRPTVRAALSSNRLDLLPFSAGEKDAKTPAGHDTKTARKDRVFPAEPLRLDGLNVVNLNVQIRAHQIFTPDLAISDLTSDLVLDNGALNVSSLKANVGGGTLDGRFGLRPQGKAVVLDTVLKVSKLDVGLVARELEVSESPSGRLDLDLNVRGVGDSVAQIMAGLSGKTLLAMSKGRISNKHIRLLGADISNTASRLFNPLGQTLEYTEINCFVSGFDISNGIAHSTALALDTNLMTVVGEGKINLKTEELDLSFKPSLKEGLGVSGLGKVNLSLELAQPFKLSGTLAKPTIALDPTQTALAIGKTVGGIAFFGPAAIAAFLASPGPTEGNMCLAAADAAKKGVKPSGSSISEEIQGTARKATEAVGDKLKKIFGR